MTTDLKMDSDEILKLINSYSQFECLWNYNIPEYKEFGCKADAWNQLSLEFGKSVEDLKKKIKNLRNAYVLEKKKVDSSKNSETGRTRRPHLFYYNHFKFLNSFIVLRKTRPSLNQTSPTTFLPDPLRTQTPPTSRQDATPEKKIKLSHPVSYTKSYLSQHASSHQKRKNLIPHSNQRLHRDRESHICSSCPCVAAQENEYDKIGKAWASELQKMNPDQQIYAKRAFAEIIFEGQMGALHRDSVTINHVHLQPIIDEAPLSPYGSEEPEPDSDS